MSLVVSGFLHKGHCPAACIACTIHDLNTHIIITSPFFTNSLFIMCGVTYLQKTCPQVVDDIRFMGSKQMEHFKRFCNSSIVSEFSIVTFPDCFFCFLAGGGGDSSPMTIIEEGFDDSHVKSTSPPLSLAKSITSELLVISICLVLLLFVSKAMNETSKSVLDWNLF